MMSNPPFVYHRRSYFSEETQRQIYLLLCQCVPSTEIARRFSISVETVHSFRKRFGITTHYGRHWTQQEDWELRNLVDQNLSIDIIAKKLHRTVQAVQKRLNDHDIQRIHRNNSIYTVAQVGRILQVGIYCITRWIDQDGLHRCARCTGTTTGVDHDQPTGGTVWCGSRDRLLLVRAQMDHGDQGW